VKSEGKVKVKVKVTVLN